MKLDILGNVYLGDVLVLGGNITVTEMLHPVYGVPVFSPAVDVTSNIDIEYFRNVLLQGAIDSSIIKFKGECYVVDTDSTMYCITEHSGYFDETGFRVDLPVNEMTYKEFIDSLVEIGYVV